MKRKIPLSSIFLLNNTKGMNEIVPKVGRGRNMDPNRTDGVNKLSEHFSFLSSVIKKKAQTDTGK